MVGAFGACTVIFLDQLTGPDVASAGAYREAFLWLLLSGALFAGAYKSWR